MSMQGWVELLAVAPTDGPTLTNTVTATSVLVATAKPVLPAQYFDKPGKMIRIRAKGRMSTVVTTPGTFTFDIRFGTTVVFTGGAMALNTVAQTNSTFDLDISLVCRAIGSGTGGTVLGAGNFSSRAVIGSPAATAGGAGELLLPDTAPVVGTGFDSTLVQTIDLFGTWSVASASNSITLHQVMIESLN